MNYERQYKLYKLGVEIPPTSLEAIKFVEDIFTKLSLAKNKEYPNTDYYIDTSDNDKVYMEDKKVYIENTKNNDWLNEGLLRCRYEGFWGVLEHEYHLTYFETQTLIKSISEYVFKLKNISPYYFSDSYVHQKWDIITNWEIIDEHS